ncbi:MAG: hypothetical protein U0360_03275 [Dehalococcoidia bacterium]
MSRYIEAMSRDELVTEVVGLVQAGVLCQHEISDPTVLPVDRLRAQVRRLRMRIVREGRIDLPEPTDLDEEARPAS